MNLTDTAEAEVVLQPEVTDQADSLDYTNLRFKCRRNCAETAGKTHWRIGT